MRDWLIKLIRAAVREELDMRLRTIEDKLTRVESNFASIAVRVKEKQEQQQKQRPRTWAEARERLEAESNG